MSAQQNPLSRGYAAIWAALNAWKPLSDLVKLGNQQNLQSPGYTPKPSAINADRPDLRLTERRIGFNPFGGNSKAVFIKGVYPLEAKSGKITIDKLNLVVFEVGRALTAAGPQLGIGDIVRCWEIPDDGAVTAKDIQSGKADWSAVFSIVLEFTILRDQFLANTYT